MDDKQKMCEQCGATRRRAGMTHTCTEQRHEPGVPHRCWCGDLWLVGTRVELSEGEQR